MFRFWFQFVFKCNNPILWEGCFCQFWSRHGLKWTLPACLPSGLAQGTWSTRPSWDSYSTAHMSGSSKPGGALTDSMSHKPPCTAPYCMYLMWSAHWPSGIRKSCLLTAQSLWLSQAVDLKAFHSCRQYRKFSFLSFGWWASKWASDSIKSFWPFL